jgi:hypothetical protein
MDISILMSAVRPKDRTDQYVILSALFVVEAHRTPVTAKQVTDVLTLHLGKNVPANVNASLRKYTACVSPSEKGPPLRWSLTEKGVERLRSLSGLALPTQSDEETFRSDVELSALLSIPNSRPY